MPCPLLKPLVETLLSNISEFTSAGLIDDLNSTWAHLLEAEPQEKHPGHARCRAQIALIHMCHGQESGADAHARRRVPGIEALTGRLLAKVAVFSLLYGARTTKPCAQADLLALAAACDDFEQFSSLYRGEKMLEGTGTHFLQESQKRLCTRVSSSGIVATYLAGGPPTAEDAGYAIAAYLLVGQRTLEAVGLLGSIVEAPCLT